MLLLLLTASPLFGQSRNLDFYLQAGRKNSPLLNELRNQGNSAFYDSLLLLASRKPQIEGITQFQYFPYYKNFGYDEVITDGGNYTAVVSVSQNILNQKDIKNKSQSVQLQKELSSINFRMSVAELDRSVTGQYLASLTVYNDLIFNIGFLDLYKKELDITSRFVTNGLMKQTDYLSLKVEAQTQELAVIQMKSQFISELMLLNALCGINDTTRVDLSVPLQPSLPVPDVRKTSGLRQFTLDSMRIANEKQAVDISYRPKFRWFADAGFLTSNPWNFYHHFGYSAGVGFSLPVYDGNQRSIQKNKLDIGENSRAMYADNFRKNFNTEAFRLKVELDNLDKMEIKTLEQADTANELVSSLGIQLESGIIQMSEYINALRNLRSVKRNLNMIKMQKLQVENEINYLINQ